MSFQAILKPWEKSRSVDRFAENSRNGVSNINSQIHSRGLFSVANTGSVNLVKSRFERKSSTPSTPLLGPRQKSATPFRNTRSPSPLLSISSLRRRSPSPVNTGNVNKFKNRFESGNSISSSNVDKYQIAAAKELSSSQQPLSPLHQTVPKAFKPGADKMLSPSNDPIYSSLETKYSGYGRNSTPSTANSACSSFNHPPTNSESSIKGSFRPLRSVGSHITASQSNLSSWQRPFLSGIQESTHQEAPSSFCNGNLPPSRFLRQENTFKPKTKLEPISSPNMSPSLSSGRGSQMSCHGQVSGNLNVKRPTVVGSIPSRFMNQEKVQDAASFLSQTLSNVSSSPPTRNRNFSAGSIPSSPASSTTSPYLSQAPNLIRGPFGYTDL